MNIYRVYLTTSTLFCNYMLPSVILCAMILMHSCTGDASTYSAYFNLRNRKTEYDHNVLHSDCLSSIFNVFFLTILLSTAANVVHCSGNKSSQGQKNHHCHYSKPVMGEELEDFKEVFQHLNTARESVFQDFIVDN